MEEWKDFSARNGHCMAHYLDLRAEAERERCIRVVLASAPRKAPFFAPALATLGVWLIKWGARLRARYDDSYMREFLIKEQR